MEQHQKGQKRFHKHPHKTKTIMSYSMYWAMKWYWSSQYINLVDIISFIGPNHGVYQTVWTARVKQTLSFLNWKGKRGFSNTALKPKQFCGTQCIFQFEVSKFILLKSEIWINYQLQTCSSMQSIYESLLVIVELAF